MSSIARPAFELPSTPLDRRGRLAELFLGPARQAAWVRPAFLGVTIFAALLYLWDLAISGWANTYYSMAAQAASQSWSAWFFGSLDAGNVITLDKPPLATMLMGLSVRLLGLSSWAILLPEALAGVGTVVVLYWAVRRSFGALAATVAGLVMAVTPVAVLIFRYDNPDALLTFVLVSAAAVLLRALDDPRYRWLVLAGTLVGLGFLTKYLQAWLVLPSFALTYALCAVGSVRHRLAGLAVGLVSVAVASGWWVAVVDAIPAAARPYIGGSSTNSVVDLILGYDGFGRILGGGGSGAGGPGGGGPGGGFSGIPGLLRMFNAQFGGQVSWLLPFAAIALVTGLVLRRFDDRTSRPVAGYLLWGTWLATHAAVFSFMTGIIHSYYAVAMVPAIAALVGAGVAELWAWRRRSPIGGLVFAGAVLVAGGWAWALLERTPTFAPGLGVAVLALGVAAALALALPMMPGRDRTGGLALGLAVAAMLAGPLAYANDTIHTAYGGGDPSAGPTTRGGSGGPGGFGGGFGGFGQTGGQGAGSGGQGAGSGAAGLGAGRDQALLDYLVANRGDAIWLVAVTGSGTAAPLQLATGIPVMAMGGFTGADGGPTLAQIQADVAAGRLRYVLAGGGGFGGGPGGFGGGPGGFGSGSGSRSGLSTWLSSACTVVRGLSTGGGALYDCAPATGV